MGETDLISRQAAIDALTEYGDGRAVYISAEEAVRRIDQLPSAQPKTQLSTEDTTFDCISRQAAIDKFEPWLNVQGYSEGERNMLKAVLYDLKFLPSVQQWIPCSECERRCDKWERSKTLQE